MLNRTDDSSEHPRFEWTGSLPRRLTYWGEAPLGSVVTYSAYMDRKGRKFTYLWTDPARAVRFVNTGGIAKDSIHCHDLGICLAALDASPIDWVVIDPKSGSRDILDMPDQRTLDLRTATDLLPYLSAIFPDVPKDTRRLIEAYSESHPNLRLLELLESYGGHLNGLREKRTTVSDGNPTAPNCFASASDKEQAEIKRAHEPFGVLKAKCSTCGNQDWRLGVINESPSRKRWICNVCGEGVTLDIHKQSESKPRSRSIPNAIKREVWRRDQGRCVECSSKELLEYDHIIPFRLGGSNTVRNIQLLCEPCNRSKGGKEPGA
jgi:hypothetical protein